MSEHQRDLITQYLKLYFRDHSQNSYLIPPAVYPMTYYCKLFRNILDPEGKLDPQEMLDPEETLDPKGTLDPEGTRHLNPRYLATNPFQIQRTAPPKTEKRFRLKLFFCNLGVFIFLQMFPNNAITSCNFLFRILHFRLS